MVTRYSNFTFSTALDIEKWASESHNIGKLAYVGAVENEKLSDSYIKTNMPIIEQQIVKGGIRLAQLLIHIFGDSQNSLDLAAERAFL